MSRTIDENDDLYMWVTLVCREYHVDMKYHEYFDDLLSSYNGLFDEESVSNWLRLQIADLFRAVDKRPQWIQEPDWPFHNGEPMIFLGQVDISMQGKSGDERIYHDDTSLYLFKAVNSGEITVITQQY